MSWITCRQANSVKYWLQLTDSLFAEDTFSEHYTDFDAAANFPAFDYDTIQ